MITNKSCWSCEKVQEERAIHCASCALLCLLRLVFKQSGKIAPHQQELLKHTAVLLSTVLGELTEILLGTNFFVFAFLTPRNAWDKPNQESVPKKNGCQSYQAV
jgi:hypothetical protein